MRILIVLPQDSERQILVSLPDLSLRRKIKSLVARGRHSQAILSALAKGRFEKEVDGSELPYLSADLILSENSARWDLKK